MILKQRIICGEVQLNFVRAIFESATLHTNQLTDPNLAFVSLELLLVFPEASSVLTVEKRDFTDKNVSMYVSIFLASKLPAGLWGLSTKD